MYLTTLFVFILVRVIKVQSACSTATLLTECTCSGSPAPDSANCATLNTDATLSAGLAYASIDDKIECDTETGFCTLGCLETPSSCSTAAGFVAELQGAECKEGLCKLPSTDTQSTSNPGGSGCTAATYATACACTVADSDTTCADLVASNSQLTTLIGYGLEIGCVVGDTGDGFCTASCAEISVQGTTITGQFICEQQGVALGLGDTAFECITKDGTSQCVPTTGGGGDDTTATPTTTGDDTTTTESATTGAAGDGATTATGTIDCASISAYNAPDSCFPDWLPGDGCAISVHFTAKVCNLDNQMTAGKLSNVIKDAFGELVDALKQDDVVCKNDEIVVGNPLKVKQTDGFQGNSNSQRDAAAGCPAIGDLCDVDNGEVEFTVEAQVQLRCGECAEMFALAQNLMSKAQDGSLQSDFDEFAEDLSETADAVCQLGFGTVEVQSPVTVKLLNQFGVLYEKDITLDNAVVYRSYLGAMVVMMAVLSFVY